MDIKKLGFGLGALAAGAVAWVIGARVAASAGASVNEHVPTDLLADGDPGAGGRAPAAFRPDPTAIPTAEEREALRPATGPAPTMVADRGSSVPQPSGAA